MRFWRVFRARAGCFAFVAGVVVCVVACFALSFALFSRVVAFLVEFIDGGRAVRFWRVFRVVLDYHGGRRGRPSRRCAFRSCWKCGAGSRSTLEKQKKRGQSFNCSRLVCRSSYVVLMRSRFLRLRLVMS